MLKIVRIVQKRCPKCVYFGSIVTSIYEKDIKSSLHAKEGKGDDTIYSKPQSAEIHSSAICEAEEWGDRHRAVISKTKGDI